jgi:hypothetical protein
VPFIQGPALTIATCSKQRACTNGAETKSFADPLQKQPTLLGVVCKPSTALSGATSAPPLTLSCLTRMLCCRARWGVAPCCPAVPSGWELSWRPAELPDRMLRWREVALPLLGLKAVTLTMMRFLAASRGTACFHREHDLTRVATTQCARGTRIHVRVHHNLTCGA